MTRNLKTKLGVAALVALGGWFGFRLYEELRPAGGAAANPGGARPQTVRVAPVEADVVRDTVYLVGSLRAKEQVDVTAKVSGRLLELSVDRGDRVRAGQRIGRLEDDELQQQVRRAEAALQVARASLEQRQAELANQRARLERYRGLHQGGVVSSEQLEQAQTETRVSEAQVNLARAQVAQAEAELSELQIRLGQTEILAPLSGVVARRYLHPGALVSPSAPIVMILNPATLVSVVNVPERELAKVHAGSPAQVVVDAVPGVSFAGRVVRVSPILDPQTRTAEIEIEIPNREGVLKAEMFARVDLSLSAERRALFVPREALVYRGTEPGVFVIENDTARFRPVATGISQKNRVEILKGLEAAETVVTQGASWLKDGDLVQAPAP